VKKIIDTGWEIKNKKMRGMKMRIIICFGVRTRSWTFFHGEILESNQVKRTPQDYINELIM